MTTTKELLGGKFSIEMWEYRQRGEPLLFLHGAGGLIRQSIRSSKSSGKTHKVYAPAFPGLRRIDRQRAYR